LSVNYRHQRNVRTVYEFTAIGSLVIITTTVKDKTITFWDTAPGNLMGAKVSMKSTALLFRV